MNIRKQRFTHLSFVEEYSKNSENLKDDLTKTLILESKEEYKKTIEADKNRSNLFENVDRNIFLEPWENKVMAYTQGDITGESLSNLLWQNTLIQKDKKNSMEESTALGLGYIDDRGKRCGLFIKYLNNNPTCWIISVSRNFDHPDPAQRSIDLFSSHDMFLAAGKTSEKPLKTVDAIHEIITTIHCEKISTILKRNWILANKAINKPNIEGLRLHTSHGRDEIYRKIKVRILFYDKKIKEGFTLFSKAPIKKQAAEKFLRVLKDDKNKELFTQEELEALHEGQSGELVSPYIDFLPKKHWEQFDEYKRRKNAHSFAYRIRY